MGKSKKSKRTHRELVAVSCADLERGYLTYFCAKGGTGCDMEASALIAKGRAIECAAVLDFLAADGFGAQPRA